MASRMPSLRRPARSGTTTEDSAEADKKRSQLPQLTPRSSAAAAKNVSSLPVSSPTRPRIASLGSVPRAKDDKTAMVPPPAPIARTQSVRTRTIPPPSSSSAASAVRSGIGAPSRSLSTRTPASLTSAAAAQKPSTHRMLPHTRTSSTSDLGDSALKRPTSISTRQLRSQSITTTTKSKLAAPTTPTAPSFQKPIDDPVKPPARRIPRSGTTSALPNLDTATSRPAFNTLQQHYSPAKSVVPKPPVPSSRVAPSAQEKAVLSGAAFETTKLQSELLYLSLLHESAAPNLQSYEKSAHKALKREFETTQREVHEVRELERLVQEHANLAALADWLGLLKAKNAHVGQEAAEAIQCLSACVNELTMLSAPESKYSTLLHIFSEWAAEAASSNKVHLFSGPLPQEWHQLHASISQRLRLVERDFEMLPPLPPRSDDDGTESSLAMLLQCLHSLLTVIKEELEAMLRLERQVVSTEKQRVGSAVGGLSLDTLLQTSDEWSPAW